MGASKLQNCLHEQSMILIVMINIRNFWQGKRSFGQRLNILLQVSRVEDEGVSAFHGWVAPEGSGKVATVHTSLCLQKTYNLQRASNLLRSNGGTSHVTCRSTRKGLSRCGLINQPECDVMLRVAQRRGSCPGMAGHRNTCKSLEHPQTPLGFGVARLSPGPQALGTTRINSACTTAYVLYLGTCDYS